MTDNAQRDRGMAVTERDINAGIILTGDVTKALIDAGLADDLHDLQLAIAQALSLRTRPLRCGGRGGYQMGARR